MKYCFHCGSVFVSEKSTCPHCQYSPEIIAGFPAYSPEATRCGNGFRPEYFEKLAELEAESFWFRGRNDLIVWALRTYGPHVRSFLEIGCGTGFVLAGISRSSKDIVLSGSELFSQGLAFAAARLPEASFMQMDARRIPFSEEFDGIGAFDVLEHIAEDRVVLSQIRQALKPGGVFLATVPQHPCLWSPIDDYACHVRRYTARDLHEKVVQAGFLILRSTSFMSFLLPVLFFSRLVQRYRKADFNPQAELAVHPVLDRIFEYVLKVEMLLLSAGAALPVGSSRLLIAMRPTE